MSLTWNYSSLLQNEFPDLAEEMSTPPCAYTSSFVPPPNAPLTAWHTLLVGSAAAQAGTLAKRTQTSSNPPGSLPWERNYGCVLSLLTITTFYFTSWGCHTFCMLLSDLSSQVPQGRNHILITFLSAANSKTQLGLYEMLSDHIID